MKCARPLRFNSRAGYAMPLNPLRSNLAGGRHPRQHLQNLNYAKIFQQHQIEFPIFQICLRCQPQTSSVARRIKNSQHQSRSFKGSLFRTRQRNANIGTAKFPKRADRGQQVPASSPHLAVNPARKSCRFCVQSHSPSAHVQPFHAIGRAHPRRVQRNGFSPRQNHLRRSNWIQRQSQSSRQIVSSTSRQHPDGSVCMPRHGVQQRLKRAIAS